MQAEVMTTTVSVPGNATLGTKEKTLYYMIVKTDKGQRVINVGEKTNQALKELGMVETTSSEVTVKQKVTANK